MLCVYACAWSGLYLRSRCVCGVCVGVKHLGWTPYLICVCPNTSSKDGACLSHSHPLLPWRLIHFKKMSPPLSPGCRSKHTQTHVAVHYSVEVTATSAAQPVLPFEADQSVLLLALMNCRSQDGKRGGKWRKRRKPEKVEQRKKVAQGKTSWIVYEKKEIKSNTIIST